jgi:hypothetical protein
MSVDGAEPRQIVVPGPTAEDDKILDPALAEASDSGTQEAVLLSRGKTARELKKEAEQKDHDRSQTFKDHFETISLIYLWLAAFALLLAAGTWIWHLIAPDTWHFLKSEQQTKLQSFLTGGIIVGVVSGHLKKRLS